MPLPKDRKDEFFKELLSINDKLFGVAFAIYDEWAWLKCIREVDNMSVSEALAIIRRVGYYADEYDDLLMKKYNVAMAGQTNAGRTSDDGGPEAPIHPSIPPNLQ
jgi:hypothetical protein